jgi:hypothetical protein
LKPASARFTDVLGEMRGKEIVGAHGAAIIEGHR